MTTITDAFKQRLQERIADLERETSVEFVPVFLDRSADYRSVSAGLLLLACGLAYGLTHFALGLPYGAQLAVFAAVALGGYLLLDRTEVWSRCVPASVRHAAVEDAAYRHFLSEEVFATRARSGVLILVSAFEQAVFVLADKGLQAAVPAETWAELGADLARDFDRHQPGESFFKALDELTKRLKSQFPPCSDNPNELGDHLRGPKNNT
jgi:putative membrane protein